MENHSFDIINVIAIGISPVIAVLVGRWLEERVKHRNDKMEIFKTLMISRGYVGRGYTWTFESVKALNIIEIVFADDRDVKAAWKELYDQYCVTNPSLNDIKKRETATYKLLECIAVSLGYKNKITWETIQNAYLPQGMIEQLNKQEKISQLMPDLLMTMMSVSNQQVDNETANKKGTK